MPSVQSNAVNIDLTSTLQSQHRDRLDTMEAASDALKRLHQSPLSSTTAATFSSLVKRIVSLACSVPDNYFLSDASGLVHEIFADFRVLLGYFEDGKTSSQKFQMAFEDIVDDCAELVALYRSFLRDPGYNGTAFPKPTAIKAMRRMALIMAPNTHDSIQERSQSAFARPIKTPTPSTFVQMDALASLQSVSPCSTSSIGSESNLLRAFDAPATPDLPAKNLTNFVSVLEAVNQLMPAPAPPSSQHGRLHEKEPAKEAAKSAMDEIARHLISTNQTSLRPPQFVDEEGDFMPTSPPPTISPVHSDDDSFTTALRQYTQKQQERRAQEANQKHFATHEPIRNAKPKETGNEYGSATSGWAK